MTIELLPFDPADALVDDEEIAWFLQDALQSGHTGVLARALECAARAKELPENAELITVRNVASGKAPGSELSLGVILKLLDALGLSLRLTREVAAAAA